MEALKYIENIADVRVSGKVKHNFCAIIFTTLCAIVSGCENRGEISHSCEVKKAWLSQYVDLSHGVPSEWTFRRLFTTLDARHMEHLLKEQWPDVSWKMGKKVIRLLPMEKPF
jgi:hypothetical protein